MPDITTAESFAISTGQPQPFGRHYALSSDDLNLILPSIIPAAINGNVETYASPLPSQYHWPLGCK
jgi:hypothetical protein